MSKGRKRKKQDSSKEEEDKIVQKLGEGRVRVRRRSKVAGAERRGSGKRHQARARDAWKQESTTTVWPGAAECVRSMQHGRRSKEEDEEDEEQEQEQ
eukprot:760802-Hanusia_phi.AAC.1